MKKFTMQLSSNGQEATLSALGYSKKFTSKFEALKELVRLERTGEINPNDYLTIGDKIIAAPRMTLKEGKSGVSLQDALKEFLRLTAMFPINHKINAEI